VADFIKLKEEDIPIETFIEITAPTRMRRVDKHAAPYFLELVKKMEPTASESERVALRDLCIRCWQSETNQVGLDDAKAYVQQHWESLDWQGRMLLIKLGHNLNDATAHAIRFQAEAMELEGALEKVRRIKRRLEDECADLRESKRRWESR
jgi:hypothetical protein